MKFLSIAHLLLIEKPPVWAAFSYCIGDFSEIVVGCVLIVAEHFGAGVAHQFQFVLVCPLDPLHHGGEGMAAAVRGVLPALDTVPFLDWIFDSAGIQHSVKYAAVSLDLHLGPILSTEYRPGHLIRNQVIHNLLYFWGNCDNPVLPGVCLCTADERPLLAVIIERVQSKKLGGAEAEIALGRAHNLPT